MSRGGQHNGTNITTTHNSTFSSNGQAYDDPDPSRTNAQKQILQQNYPVQATLPIISNRAEEPTSEVNADTSHQTVDHSASESRKSFRSPDSNPSWSLTRAGFREYLMELKHLVTDCWELEKQLYFRRQHLENLKNPSKKNFGVVYGGSRVEDNQYQKPIIRPTSAKPIPPRRAFRKPVKPVVQLELRQPLKPRLPSMSEIYGLYEAYISAVTPIRNACLAYQKNRVKYDNIQDQLIEFSCSNYLNVDPILSEQYIREKIEKLSTMYSKSEDMEIRKIGVMYDAISFFTKNNVVYMDMLFLFSKQNEETFQQDLDQQYYKMVTNVTEWNKPFQDQSAMSMNDLLEVDIETEYKEHFVQYINFQRCVRFDLEEVETLQNLDKISLAERKLCRDYVAIHCHYINWQPADTKHYLNTRLLGLKDRPSSSRDLYRKFYRFLLEIRSVIVDFDTYWATTYLRQKKINDEDIERVFFQLMFGLED